MYINIYIETYPKPVCHDIAGRSDMYRANKVADDLARLEAVLTYERRTTCEHIPHRLKKYFQLWKKKNHNRAWIETEGCGRANRWTAGLLLLSRLETKTLVGLITGHIEVKYHSNKT